MIKTEEDTSIENSGGCDVSQFLLMVGNFQWSELVNWAVHLQFVDHSCT